MYAVSDKPYFTLEDAVVPMYHPRVLFETAVSQGVDPDQLLLNTGLTTDMFDNPRARASYAQFGALARNAMMLTENPALGIDFGKRIHLGNLGMLGLALLASGNAQDAVDTILTYGRVVSPGFALSSRSEGNESVLVIRPTVPMGALHAFAVEAVLKALSDVARFLLQGAPLPVVRLHLDYPRPAYAERYEEITEAEIVWDSHSLEVVFARDDMSRRLGFGDPLTAREAKRICDFELSQLPGTGLLEQVRSLLAKTPGEYPSLHGLARELGTSARSLRRALARLGSSYQALLFEVRKEHALDYIRSTHLSVEGLAQRLGFSDARAFRRAFKRWTGLTPSEYRQTMLPAPATAADEEQGANVQTLPTEAVALESFRPTLQEVPSTEEDMR